MGLTPTRNLMDSAIAAGNAIGAFNVITLETAEALIDGAEQAGLPVILQISENCVSYHGSLEPLAAATLAAARAATIPVAVHLDHAQDEALARQAVDLGFGSVMYDGAHLDYAANVTATATVAEYAHANGVYLEAELGAVGGKDGAHAPGVRTDPQEAVDFVAATGADALAVAVGSSHAMTERSAALDIGLIRTLSSALPVPLVLHGSSGVPDAMLAQAVAAGMVKINVATHLNGIFSNTISQYMTAHPSIVDPRKYLGAARGPVAAEVSRMLSLFASGSGGTA